MAQTTSTPEQINAQRPDRLDAPLLAAIAASIYFLQSLAWPLSPGRDCMTYLIYYLEMEQPEPLYHLLMLFRTPIAPLFHGLVLQLGGVVLDETLMGLLYCCSILITYRIGLHWNRRIAWIAALALALHPGYAIPYHQVSSEGLFAFGFIAWAWLVFGTQPCAPPARFALHGVMVFLLVLIRPAAQALLAFVAYPLLLPGLPAASKLKRCAAFLLTSLALLAAYSTYNLVRYNDFTVSRSGGAMLPLHRLFVSDKIPIRAENGPASTALLQAIETDLLLREPYAGYGIDLETFLTSGDSRMWADLAPLSDRTWGWDSDYQMLFRAAIETVRSEPLFFTYKVLRSFGGVFLRNQTLPAPQPVERGETSSAPGDKLPQTNDQGLPLPSEGQLIPASNTWWLASSPDQRLQYNWQSFYETSEVPFTDDRLNLHSAELGEKLHALVKDLPPRAGLSSIANPLNWVARFYPVMLLWLLVGAAGLILKPTRQVLSLWFLIGLSLIYLGITFLGSYAIVYFRLPFDPMYILAGVVGGAAILDYIQRFLRKPSNL